jgi:hypothetical protein
VASAYGWVTIVIFSMVKQAHPLYSNKNHSRGILGSRCPGYDQLFSLLDLLQGLIFGFINKGIASLLRL